MALRCDLLDERVRLGCPSYYYWASLSLGNGAFEAIASKICEISKQAHFMIGWNAAK